MESYEFYSIISSLAAVCERAVILASYERTDGRRKEGCLVEKRGDGVRLFVFATGQAFISNPQSPSVINHNWIRAARTRGLKKIKKGEGEGREGKEKAKTFRIGLVSNDFKHPLHLSGSLIDGGGNSSSISWRFFSLIINLAHLFGWF